MNTKFLNLDEINTFLVFSVIIDNIFLFIYRENKLIKNVEGDN